MTEDIKRCHKPISGKQISATQWAWILCLRPAKHRGKCSARSAT